VRSSLGVQGTTISDALKYNAIVTNLKKRGGDDTEFINAELEKTYPGGAKQFKEVLDGRVKK